MSWGLQFEDNEVGYIRGRVTTHVSSTVPVLEPASLDAPSASTQLASQKSTILGSRSARPLPNSTMIGELKLTVLKARLATIGISAELVGEGVLICGAGARAPGEPVTTKESVAVRKFGRGKVELEGNVSDIYYAVRSEVYKLYACVSA